MPWGSLEIGKSKQSASFIITGKEYMIEKIMGYNGTKKQLKMI